MAGLAPSVEIVQPAPGAVLAPDLAPSTLLKLRVENAALTSDGEGVLVALDGQRPRRVLIGRPLTLAELLPFGASLKAGPHALLAVAVDAQGRTLRAVPGADKAVSVLTFFVGTPPAPQGSTPTSTPRSVFCLSPVGTAYINPGDALVFEVLAFGGAEPSRVRVRTRHFDFELPFDAKRAFALRGLPPGDARLSVGGEPSSECVVTLNAAPEARP